MTSEFPDRAAPALLALDAAIAATGLHVETRERPKLERVIARMLPPGAQRIDDAAFRAALCTVRRKPWGSRLMDLTRRAGQVWVTRADTEAAAMTVDDPEPDDARLLAALTPVLREKLRAQGDTPRAAMDNVRGDLFDGTGRTLAPTEIRTLALAVADAFAVADPEAFATELEREDTSRKDRDARIEETARTRRREEVLRLREWEKSLVPFSDVPGLLRCSQREALRWIAENRLPVARRVPQAGGQERWEFDPGELMALRQNLPQWRREGPQGPGRAPLAPDLGNQRIGNAVIAQVAALDRYAAHFRTARALKRRITLVTGPTNSGKSHTALDALARAESGLALAPLRLLAHEFRESLTARGVPTSLATGEERIDVPGSRHLAATVEMCPLNNPVDVAIIDEAQMLTDPDRGAAWTAAIMGAPARHLFILGAPDCIPMVRRIAELCGDPIDEIRLERKSPLVAAERAVSLHELQKHDALIAFSRREVLDLRALLLAHGKRVAVVYGALSPEVRRAEAQRFNNGDADILIATDAIGMGLNLTIRRVVFAALRKYDGNQTRDLNPQEVKQIGGRAGRFGKHEQGVVAVLEGVGSPSFIHAMLAAPPQPIEDMRPQVQPDADIVQAVAAEIGSDSLFGVLVRIRRAVLRRDDPNYRLANMEQAFAIATALEGVPDLTLAQRWVYAMCPVDDRDNGIQRLVHWAADHAAGNTVPPPGTGRLPAAERAERTELERAEKRHKRLVAWRWLALRFPETYVNREEAEGTTARLDEWIEDVLRQQSIRARAPNASPFRPDSRASPPGRRGRDGGGPPKGKRPHRKGR
ncbi:ATP-dependent RNA helicase suv3 [Gluconacetobacter sp. SXCC-1]|uniref:RNA helicase n=1 Tax=Komagataeibacter rhaeticus TaxID=215221 RepID=A0A858JFC4_9PROT|nr:helicase-related protein [Komagataeibacter rhaeticus]ATU74431.1 RNA helicase [Komagataeibacter xylinus]EGG75852.1 ATP-dependent RNA helicase suv3 [Gluconacetobacter sp. SXCC-1]QIP34640.1 RNA helicase [Komagataeibacter rhaeticus]QOC47162.1 RNA helicase [Komagataeibacter rhaeticus]WPP20500.1 helicase-related protein [Komagataeibacter rhaeticus]